jgi:hypothetical protein
MAKNTVIVSVLGDTRDLQRKMGGAGGIMSKFGKVAAAATAIAGAAVVGLGAKAVKSASQLEQNMGAMESVFKSSAGQMTKWATTAASTVGLAKSEYAGLATVLGSQLKNMGVAQAQLGTQTNKLIGLGADLAAQFGGSTSDAVSALSSLLRGERDPIERYGVSINEAAVKAKLAEMGLAGLTGEAEKNAKLSATLALLYAQTADAQGAFTRESTTLAGAQQRLAAGAENLVATLGTSLLPAVTAVTAAIGTMINKIQESAWFQTLTQNLSNASNAFADFVFGILNGTQTLDFGALFGSIIPAITSAIQNAAAWISGGGLVPVFAALTNAREGFFTAAITLFQAITDALPEILPAAVEALVTFIQQLATFLIESLPVVLDAAVQLFTAIVTAIPLIVPQLVTGLVTIITDLIPVLLGMIPTILDAAVQLMTALIDALPIILPDLLAAVIGLLPVLIATLIGLIPKLLTAAVKLFTALVTALPQIIPKLITKLIEMAPKIIRTLIGMIPQLLESGKQLFMAIVTAIPTIAGKLGPALIRLLPRMVSAVKGMIPQMLAAGRDLVAGLARGLAQNAGRVVSGLLSIARNAIGAFKRFFGINSPSRLMASMGGFLTQGLGGGIDKGISKVRGTVRKLSTAVTDSFAPTLDAPALADVQAVTVNGAGGSARGVGNVYNITVNAVTSSVETGRAIVNAIRDYERFERNGVPA